MEELKDKIAKWLDPKLSELNCFLVDIKVMGSGNRIEVYIDNEENVKISTCETVSRYLEFYLDNDTAFPEHYILDVSSPGLENPFRVKRQYLKSIGKTIEIILNDGVKIEGILIDINDGQLKLQTVVGSKIKGRKPHILEEIIELDNIKYTKKKISF